MAKKNGTPFVSEDLAKQREYVQKLEQQHFAFPLIAAESFVRGMRDSGYRSTATALNELIDNAIQAQATQVDIVLGYEPGNTSKKKQDVICIIDNGHGMDPGMMKAAVMWGGTHRENDRSGFGRFGFGLPSASVSIARRYTVISRVLGGNWMKLTIDLDEIAHGRITNEEGLVMVPDPEETTLPKFVKEILANGDMEQGTIIILEKLDRLSPGYVTTTAFKQNELHQIGVTYRELLRTTKIRVIDIGNEVDITDVEPIDPMFLRSDARYYDETDVKSEAFPDARAMVKDASGKDLGWVTIRYAYMPPGFLPDESKASSPRLKVRKENSGLMILRSGRQIDVLRNVVSKSDKTRYNAINNDKHWAVEIHFEPVLDEEFGVTTNKQQITLTDRMLDILKDMGLFTMISSLRKKYGKDHNYDDAKKQPKEKLSEEIVTEASKFLSRKVAKQSVDKERKAKEAVDREATKRAKEKGTTPEAEKAAIEAETHEKPYKLFPEADRGEFYRVELFGGQHQLYINTSHRFYSDVYNHPMTPKHVKVALELLLFTMGICELESEDDRAIFYRNERAEWTRRLDTYLQLLDRKEPVADAQDSAEEEAEEAAS